jgi:SAM-dependent methyltransferase
VKVPTRRGRRTVTGERVVTAESGFNPTWQRHVAAYAAAAELLPATAEVLDLACGIGHSHHLLAPRRTVGVDRSAHVLRGQRRPTVVADMRALPFPPGRFDAALAVHAIEHVDDPERVLVEVVRVLRPGGTAILVTPNRLTFARPHEVVDPYHHREYDPEELRALCGRWFGSVRVLGLFGSHRYLALLDDQRSALEHLLGLDPLRTRRLVPRRVRQLLYDRLLTRARRTADPRAGAITPDDFRLGEEGLEACLDVAAVCRRS